MAALSELCRVHSNGLSPQSISRFKRHTQRKVQHDPRFQFKALQMSIGQSTEIPRITASERDVKSSTDERVVVPTEAALLRPWLGTCAPDICGARTKVVPLDVSMPLNQRRQCDTNNTNECSAHRIDVDTFSIIFNRPITRCVRKTLSRRKQFTMHCSTYCMRAS